MRIIKLSRNDEEMPTRNDVVRYFNVTLRRKWCHGKFGLSRRKRNMPDVRRGTLLVFSYQTELMYLARADGEVVHDGDPYFDDYLPLDMATLRPVSGSLHDFERALHREGRFRALLVRTREWPRILDTCDSFVLGYFKQPRSAPPMAAVPYRELKRRLDDEMLRLFDDAGRETGYWGRYYLRSVRKHGGLEAARRLLRRKAAGKIDKGLLALIDAGRADELSVEAIALRREFRPLFSEAEVAEASRRLERIPSSARQQPVPPSDNYPDTVSPSRSYVEGAVRKVLVNAYERDPEARADCLRHHGYDCMVCGANFQRLYGTLGRRFIHVHHKKPFGLARREYKIRPTLDLVPVCPNCHAMLHAKKPPLTVEQLRQIWNQQRALR